MLHDVTGGGLPGDRVLHALSIDGPEIRLPDWHALAAPTLASALAPLTCVGNAPEGPGHPRSGPDG